MAAKKTNLLQTIAFTLFILLGTSSAQAISTWICGSGNYSNTSCWDPPFAIPPCNFDTVTFDVMIPASSSTVSMDIGTCEVSSFYLGLNRVFRVLSGNTYSVIGQADIYGIIWGDGGDFIAPIAAFPGNKARVAVSGGATVVIGAPTYSSTGFYSDHACDSFWGCPPYTQNYDLFFAIGEDTFLDLSSIQSIYAGFDDYSGDGDNDTNIQKITASGGAIIDLSGLHTTTAPRRGNDSLRFIIDEMSDIYIPSLQHVKSLGTGKTYFEIGTSASLSLPAIEDSSWAIFALYSMSKVDIGENMSTISNTRFYLNEGAQFTDNGASSSYSSTGLYSDHTCDSFWGCDPYTQYYDLFKATGEDTVLDLSSIQSINAGFDDYSGDGDNDTNIQKITASGGAKVNLSGLHTTTAPRRSNDSLRFTIDEMSDIYIPSLQHVKSLGTGKTYFDIGTSASLSLPAIEDISWAVFVLDSMSQVDIGENISTISNTRFLLSEGAQFTDNGVSSSYSSTGLYSDHTCDSFWGCPPYTQYYDLFKATGDTVLDLSSIQSINAGFDDYSGDGDNDTNIQKITASGGAIIDLSGTIWLKTPKRSNDSVECKADIHSLVDLSMLETIYSAGSGLIKIIANGNSSINAPNLSNVNCKSEFIIDNESKIMLGDLDVQASGTTFTVNGSSILRTKGLRASKSTTITLKDPNDLLEVTGDFDLGTTITISNPGDAKLALGGDFTYAHTVETKVQLGKSYVYFNGRGPQELEVGGYDVALHTEMLANDNFGFGQMLIGRCEQPTGQPAVVLLVDYINNGNRGGFGGGAEALYLFGKDADANGLRILSGSTLYMGNLNVYAMINGVMTDLRTLFAPGETCITFDEGTLCLGYPDVDGPDNLITNGGFENGVNPPDAADPCIPLPAGSNDITSWTVVQNGIDWIHETYFTDPPDPCESERTVDLCGTAAGEGGIRQTIETVPGNLYHIFFDLGANPYGNRAGDAGTKILNVSATGDSEEFSFDSTNKVGPDPGHGNPWQVYWQKKAWRFIATEETTTLVFASVDPNTEFGVAIDNVIVHDTGIFMPCDHVGTCWDPRECAGQRFGDATCDGDVNAGAINLGDLMALKKAWGDIGPPWTNSHCCADFDHDGKVNLADLMILKMNWGRTGFIPSTGNQACPEPGGESRHLIGHWRLDETTGTTAYDISGNGHDGTCLGGLSFDSNSIAGVHGNAISLDGIDDRIEIPPLNLNSERATITVWVKRDGPAYWDGVVFSRSSSTLAGLIFGEENEMRYCWSPGTSSCSWNSGLIVPNDQWTFVALVVEPTKGTIYMDDGTGMNSATNYAPHYREQFEGVTYIGLDAWSHERCFKGSVDDVRIYNWPLTAAEIDLVAADAG